VLDSRQTAIDIGARLDRLDWSRRHLGLLLALGAGWMFDSLEVNLVGSMVGPMSDHFNASTRQASTIYWVWLLGVLFGAIAGGWLADRFGRRRLFLFTLLWYAGFTILTAFSPTLTILYCLRFLTALGVGAEYSIINAAIAEFMPSRVRGRSSAVVMNFWPLGAILSGLIAYLMLNILTLPNDLSWRFGFALGGLVALAVLFLRRKLPESPRWLVAQGRTGEAEAIVARLEEGRSAVRPLAESERPPFPARSAVRELVTKYPGRLLLGCILDLSEAFGYYGIFALLSIVVLTEVEYTDVEIPGFFIMGNVGALAGGILMAIWFDRLGRKFTVAGCYALAAGSVYLLALATESGSKTWVLVAFMVSSGFATAAWTSAYPTFTELFPTHVRAVGVGISVGTGRLGAAYGTLYLPSLAERIGPTASYLLIAGFWLLGCVAMVVWSLVGGVDAARKPLEELQSH
jgi:MFS family permease